VLDGKAIAVVVPCFNEESNTTRVLGTVPDYVDHVIVVDDQSTDETVARTRAFMAAHDLDGRISLIAQEVNSGVGAGILAGYHDAMARKIDIAVVMAGDGQIDPKQLRALLRPVLAGRADYAKANRLYFSRSWEMIPHHRYLGNAFLSMLTKVASGYWHVTDSQTATPPSACGPWRRSTSTAFTRGTATPTTCWSG